MGESDISSIDYLVMREFVSGPPRYHLAIKGVREQFVVLPHIFFRSTVERILFWIDHLESYKSSSTMR